MPSSDQFLKRKVFFERHLTASLDVLLCAQLIIIYLHDTSTLRLIAGFLLQLTTLTPRTPTLAHIALNRKNVILSIIGYNLWCILSHLIFGPAESRNNYLHGGLTIEFIGVRPLESRIPLIFWDTIVILLQWSLFSLNFPVNTVGTSTASAISPSSTAAAEEDRNGADEEASENDPLSNSYSTRPTQSDAFATGNVVVRDIRILQSIAGNWSYESPREHGEDGDSDDSTGNSSNRNDVASRLV